MNNATLVTLDATVIPGFGVASGNNPQSPYPQGSIAMQTPFFKELGVDVSTYYQGTLNLDCKVASLQLRKADYCFEKLKWNSTTPPETFSFVRCALLSNQGWIDGLIYYPHPETKPDHIHPDNLLEVLAPFTEEFQYGTSVKIRFSKDAFEIEG